MHDYRIEYIRISNADGSRCPMVQTITARSESEAVATLKRMDVNQVIIKSVTRVH